MDLSVLLVIAAAIAILHIATNGRYGFHRDELQFLSDARHLDWGYVSYPPLDPFIERIGLDLFGLSLMGLRIFSVIGQAVAIVLTGLMARDLGGNRGAQVAAALSIALSGLPLFNGTEFQYTSFDFLWWVLIAYFTILLLKTENPRWWIGIGAAIGLGLLTKYSIVFYIAGILAGLVLSPARRFLRSGWFWAGFVLALLVFLPNFLWLIRHDFISYEFLQHIHARDVAQGRAEGFFKEQFLLCLNPAAAPLAVAGLIAYFSDRRYRMLSWMFVVPFALFYLGKGRFYYVAAAYPMIVAMGAVCWERWLRAIRITPRRVIATVFYIALAVCGARAVAIVIPLASSGPLRDFALKNNGDLREEIGWDELVRTVAGIRDSLPLDQRDHLGIATGNYGEYGAIEMLGPGYGLPAPIGTTNSEWLRGYPSAQLTTFIVLGNDRDDADSIFTNCRLAGHNGNSEGIRNEESLDHPDIFVCGPPRLPWAEVWKQHKDFG